MNKLHAKISMKGILAKCGYQGICMLKTDRMLNIMATRFGYRMRPENWHTIKLPTPAELKRRTKDAHPERGMDEFFVGNINVSKGVVEPPDYLKHLSTIRIGQKSFDINGVPISHHDMRPLFVHKTEFGEYNRIMSKRLRTH